MDSTVFGQALEAEHVRAIRTFQFISMKTLQISNQFFDPLVNLLCDSLMQTGQSSVWS